MYDGYEKSDCGVFEGEDYYVDEGERCFGAWCEDAECENEGGECCCDLRGDDDGGDLVEGVSGEYGAGLNYCEQFLYGNENNPYVCEGEEC